MRLNWMNFDTIEFSEDKFIMPLLLAKGTYFCPCNPLTQIWSFYPMLPLEIRQYKWCLFDLLVFINWGRFVQFNMLKFMHIFNGRMQVWKNYVCQVSTNNVCTTVGRLTPSMYQQMSSAVNVSYGLYRYGPFLTDLMDCTFVRDTFRSIHNDHCHDLKRYSKWVHIGLALVSAAVALSLIFWLLYARERRHRKYTKLADARSIQDSIDRKGPAKWSSTIFIEPVIIVHSFVDAIYSVHNSTYRDWRCSRKLIQ